MGWALYVLEKTIVAIIAFVFGVVAFVETSRSRGRIKGRWLAVIGLLLSYAYLSIAALLLAQDRMLLKSPRAVCLSNMKVIGVAIAMYADQRDQTIPKTFEDLQPYAPDLGKFLICPASKDTRRSSYQILLGGKKWNGPGTVDTVVMTEPLSNHHGVGRNALYGDGHVGWQNH